MDLLSVKMKSSIFDSLRMMNERQKNPEAAQEEHDGNYLIVYPNILKADASPHASRRALTNLELLHPAAGVGSGPSAGLA